MLEVRLFGELAKVEDQDDGSVMVYGVASSGARDEAGECVLPEAMKAALPEYGRYPALREMHGLSAAGRTLEAVVEDDGKTRIVAHVVDPVAVAKVKSKTYAGFSIGGKVLARDPSDRTVITKLKLNEISLVDRPCNPEAAIDLWKADVETEAMNVQPTNDEVKAEAEAMAKAAGKDGKWKDFVVKAREKLLRDRLNAESDAELAAILKASHADLTDEAVAAAIQDILTKYAAGEGETLEALAAAWAPAAEAVVEKVEGAEIAPEPAADPATALADALAKAKAAKDKPYGDVKYADPKNSKYPIDTAKHIRAAWSYINMPKNQKGYTADELTAIKDKIVAAWKDKIDADGPPSAEKMAAFGDLEKAAPALVILSKRGDTVLAKGLYTVGRLAELMQSMAYLQNSVAWETADEGDGSSQPTDAANIVADMGALLVNMAQEEVSEILQAYKDAGLDLDCDAGEDDMEVVAYASSLLDLCKADEAFMAKVGARNSKSDMEKIQGIHDHATGLGALCKADNCPADESEKAQGVEDLAKAQSEVERLSKALSDAIPAVEDLQKTIATQGEDLAKALGSIETLTKRLEQVENEPAQPRTAGSARAIAKSDDAANTETQTTTVSKSDVDAYLATLSDHDRAMLLTKAALQLPMSA